MGHHNVSGSVIRMCEGILSPPEEGQCSRMLGAINICGGVPDLLHVSGHRKHFGEDSIPEIDNALKDLVQDLKENLCREDYVCLLEKIPEHTPLHGFVEDSLRQL